MYTISLLCKFNKLDTHIETATDDSFLQSKKGDAWSYDILR